MLKSIMGDFLKSVDGLPLDASLHFSNAASISMDTGADAVMAAKPAPGAKPVF